MSHAGTGIPESCPGDLPRLLGEACMVCHFRHHQSCWVVPTAEQSMFNIPTELLQDVMYCRTVYRRTVYL